MTTTARGGDVGTASALYRVGACKATRCGQAAIRWVPTAKVHPRTGHRLLSGDPIPLDHGTDPDGQIVIDQHPKTRELTARPFDPDTDDPDRDRYAVHWTSCHTPALYREAKAAADPRGMLPPLERPRRGTTTAAGYPCGVCRGPGGGTLGRLCLPCARVAVDRWSPAMQPTIAVMPDTLRALLDISSCPSCRRFHSSRVSCPGR